MIRLNIFLILLLMLNACRRDHLYFALGEQAKICFQVDWEKSKMKPNGVSAYIYDHATGKAIQQCEISSDPDKIEVFLPVGNYDVLFINDTESELSNISFHDIDNFNEICPCAIDSKGEKWANLAESESMHLVEEPNLLAHTLVRNIQIDELDVKYYENAPDLDSVAVNREIDVAPERVTEIVNIKVHVKNLTSAAGAPWTLLTNMCGGYFLGLDCKENDLVAHDFILNNRVIDPNNSNHGTITKKLRSFGPMKKEELTRYAYRHELIMKFILKNGQEHVVREDVTDVMLDSYDGIRNVYSIDLEIELPEGIEGDDGGAFDPDLGEWEDVVVELPY